MGFFIVPPVFLCVVSDCKIQIISVTKISFVKWGMHWKQIGCFSDIPGSS